jgi:solute carrier family 25 carnitine/acylcarnitine transporter 20/29
VGVGACVSIQFGALEYMKRYFQSRNSDPKQSLSLSQLFLSGAASGIANSVLSGPIEHVRTRLQVQSGPVKAYNGPWDFIKKAYAQNGIAGIYKGQGITLMREFWGYGIYFATYEALMQRTMEKEYKKRNEIEAWKQITFGACSGYLLW